MMVTQTRSGSLRAGVAIGDITPPVGVELSGGAFGPARDVLHPLHAKALYLEAAGTHVLLVVCDLLGFDWNYGLAIREEIARTHGFDVDAILLACTHTHCGPATVTLRHWGRSDPAYRKDLHARLVRVAGEAVAAAQPARLGAGSILCPGVAVNRVFGAQGQTDDELGLVRLEDASGKPLAILLNYACHPVNLHSSGLLTPDFPQYVETDIQASLETPVPVLYLSGAGGDLNPANFKGQTPNEEHARETAGKISSAALKLLPEVKTAPVERLAFAARDVRVPLQPLPSEKELRAILAERQAKLAALTESQRIPSNWEYCGHKSTIEWANEALAVRASGKQETSLALRLWAVRVGDVGLVGVPGEPFTEFGMGVRRSGLLPHVLFASLVNGCFGYFPNRAAYEKGSYEAVICPRFLGVYAFGPTVGEMVCVASVGLLRSLA